MSKTPIPIIQRDISWLSFNYRVLQEAKDPTVPLLERLKFLAIYSNNLDEFFRVRVANHRNLVRLGKKTKKQLHFLPEEILSTILEIVNKQQEEFSDIFENDILPSLKENGINIRKGTDLDEDQIKFIEDYFSDNMLPFVQPILLLKGKIKPFLNNNALYLIVDMFDRELKLVRYAILKIPSDYLPRFVELPSSEDQNDIILIDDIVRHNMRALFPGYDINDSYSIKLTRDAELYIDDEYSGNLVQKIKKGLIKRNVGPASRLVYDRTVPKQLLKFLAESFELGKFDLFLEGRYHNNMDFMKLPSFGKNHLKQTPLPPMSYPPLEQGNIFDAIKEKDHLNHVPYQSYESVIRFFEEAAKDPKVSHIKAVQYRVARKSRIMQALIDAAKSGKNVSVFIEVKARFDEEANLKWGERLEKAGVNVNYSFPGLKVHVKCAMIRRVKKGKPEIYTYLSTGNFHEQTAKVYSDLGIFSNDKRYTREVVRLFYFLETVKVPKSEFKHLLVGQFNLRNSLEDKIFREISNAKKGLPAKIILKLNSLQDERMIEFLYEASQAGVEIKLIVRGICSLIPQKKGYSENINAISIVDRYLEHARVYVFHNKGNDEVYISSADWMVRNLSHRIETAVPIYDKEIKETILELLEIQFNDNVKARSLNHKSINDYYNKDESTIPFQSQLETYYYMKRRTDEIMHLNNDD
jgi:polyphosphate kinase